MSQELVTYIVLGSESRLKNVKLPLDTKYEEYLLSNLSAESSYQNQLDDLVTSCKGELVVFLPPSSFPNSEAKESLKYILFYLKEENITKINNDNAREIINKITVKHSIKKGILMKSLRVAFFGCLSGPDLIQSWELFSENKIDIPLIERCFN